MPSFLYHATLFKVSLCGKKIPSFNFFGLFLWLLPLPFSTLACCCILFCFDCVCFQRPQPCLGCCPQPSLKLALRLPPQRQWTLLQLHCPKERMSIRALLKKQSLVISWRQLQQVCGFAGFNWVWKNKVKPAHNGQGRSQRKSTVRTGDRSGQQQLKNFFHE